MSCGTRLEDGPMLADSRRCRTPDTKRGRPVDSPRARSDEPGGGFSCKSVRNDGLGKSQSLVSSHAFCLPGRPHEPTPTPTKHRDFLPPNPLVRNPTSTPTNTNMSGTAPPDCQRKVNSTANNKLQKVWAGSGALQRVLIYARCVLPRLAVSKF